jgi:hypothetical protein
MKKLLTFLVTTACFGIFSFAPGVINAQHSPNVTINQPNGGEQLVLGSTYLISWTPNIQLKKNVEIQLSTNGGGSYTSITPSGGVSGSTWSWNIPASYTGLTPPINNCKIQIKSINGQILGASEAAFSIVSSDNNATIHVEQPNGGESWALGTTNLISWTKNFDGNVDIYLNDYSSYPTGQTNYQIASNVSGNSYSWPITAAFFSSKSLSIPGQFTIGVYKHDNHAIRDLSDSRFSVITSPVGSSITINQPDISGIKWAQNTSHLISWSSTVSGKFDIYLSNPGGNDYPATPLFTGVSGSTKTWDIGSTLTGAYKIKVVSETYNTVVGESSNTFSVVADAPGTFVTLIQPNGGESWALNTQHMISWTKNFDGNVDVYLNASSGNYLIKSGVSGNSYNWTVTNVFGTTTLSLTGNYTIGVYKTGNHAIHDLSDNPFNITKVPVGSSITLIQPNIPGIQWAQNTSHLISWASTLPGPVKIKLSSNGGVSFSTIPGAESVSGSTWTWDIGTKATGTYQIKVVDLSDNHINAIGSPFEIVADAPGTFVQVIQPNGGEKWALNTQHLISWTKNFDGNVDIYLNDYSTGSQVNYQIASNVSGNSYSWAITAAFFSSKSLTIPGQFTIGVYKHDNHAIRDLSDSHFSVITSPEGSFITVIQPNGGETWNRGQAYLISWTGNLPNENYNVYLHHYDIHNQLDLANSQTIATNVPQSTTTWTINSSQALGAHYRVFITGNIHTSIADSSDTYFSIVEPLKISTYPNPTSNSVTLKVTDATSNNYVVNIYNRYGTRVWQGNLNTNNTNNLHINTYDWPNGIYFATLSGGPKQLSQIFIVQH